MTTKRRRPNQHIGLDERRVSASRPSRKSLRSGERQSSEALDVIMQDSMPAEIEYAIERMAPKQVDNALEDPLYTSPGRGERDQETKPKLDGQHILRLLEKFQASAEKHKQELRKQRKMKRILRKRLIKMKREFTKQQDKMRQEIKKRHTETTREFEGLRIEIRVLRQEVSATVSARGLDQNAMLAGHFEQYSSIGNPQVNVFRPDLLRESYRSSGTGIAGNKPPQVGLSGDVIKDTYSYTSGRRTDHSIFIKGYGLTAIEMKFLIKNNCSRTLAMFGRWSAGKISARWHWSPEKEAAFSKFVAALRKDLRADPAVGKTELSEAYWGLLKLL